EASEKKFRLLSENSRDIIAIFSLDNKFEYVSPACETLLGFEPHELIGRDGAELVHPDDVEKLVKPSTKANAGDDNQNPHFRLRRKDGRYIWIEAISNPIHDKDGRITAIQTSSRDITLRKEMEIALKEEKTRAEQATAAKSAFLSMMSHEIRTPMNAIIGLTNILLREPHLPEQAESLGLLKFSGENLLTIINDILDFSKIEAGKITFENVAFDLHEMLANTCAVMSSRARDKSIRLSVNLGEDLPRFVWSDQVRLNQIITNLIGNGIKFTEQGFVELSVTFGGLDEHGKSRINFQVRDTGIGIDADKLATIFESFSQASSDTTRRFGGTGLGLSITKQLLNLMGSDIRVSSQVGRGTCFDFTLHLLAAEASDGQETGRKNGKDISRRAGSVLLVEDNPINQVVAVKFLTKWGLDVKVANDGSEAVDIAREKKFHAILMDLQMPRMDGYEAARKIRALDDPYYKTVPIIALTASAMSDIKEAAALSGMNGFVSKPFQPDELYGVLSTYIPENTNGMHESRVTVNCLDLYSEADPDLRRELAGLIIKNIHELNATLNDSLQPGDDHPFVSAAHKVKTVISMVGITEYTILVEEIIEHLKEISPATGLGEKLNRFKHLSNIICHGLQEELGSV
ncbi:MAG TPA: ATP-binding protein, partial [Chryseosolibacter sp.]|nr:ATP-binding protein [Chryseosolibacter sp.]